MLFVESAINSRYVAMKTMVEHGRTLEIVARERRSDFGIAYWQARYSFATGTGTARLHGVTVALHRTEEAAEQAALAMARTQGWGRSPSVHNES